jgi:hypothetical protein
VCWNSWFRRRRTATEKCARLSRKFDTSQAPSFLGRSTLLLHVAGRSRSQEGIISRACSQNSGELGRCKTIVTQPQAVGKARMHTCLHLNLLDMALKKEKICVPFQDSDARSTGTAVGSLSVHRLFHDGRIFCSACKIYELLFNVLYHQTGNSNSKAYCCTVYLAYYDIWNRHNLAYSRAGISTVQNKQAFASMFVLKTHVHVAIDGFGGTSNCRGCVMWRLHRAMARTCQSNHSLLDRSHGAVCVRKATSS